MFVRPDQKRRPYDPKGAFIFLPRRLHRPPPSTTSWSPHPLVGGGQVLRYRCPRSLQAVDSKFLEEKGTVPLRHLPTPIQGVGGERSEPEGVSRQVDTIHVALVIIMAST